MATILYYKINKAHIAHRVIGQEAVMLNLDNGCYYSLDKIGTKIWKAIDENKSIGEMVDILKEKYAVTEVRLKKDISRLISRLEKVKLIIRV